MTLRALKCSLTAFLAAFFATLAFAPHAAVAQAAPVQPAPPARDGSHDFDFDMGPWRTLSSRLLRPLTGSTEWVEMAGTTIVRPIWGGKGNIAEFSADGPSGHLELISLRLYDPSAHQWNLNFATPSVGVVSVPMIGSFENGRGVFYDQESYNGRTILVRFTIFSLSSTQAQSEQAFSNDGGITWETNWINRYTRLAQ